MYICICMSQRFLYCTDMHNAARRRHVGGVRYTIHFEIVGQGWEKGRKAVSFFRRYSFPL